MSNITVVLSNKRAQMALMNEKFFDPISIVVPTYKEAKNLPHLIERLLKIRASFSGFEILIVDDNSDDGSEEYISGLQSSEIRIHVRKSNRGLSPSVIDGIRMAQFDQVCVMDADLSHPPESIPELVEMLVGSKADMVVGSRYVKGGQIDLEWSWFRHFNSQMATLLARPFTNIKDPMSGFFVLRKKLFDEAKDLNPIGYKIALELIVKGNAKLVKEVPIHFSDRLLGESKLTVKEQLNYIRHIKRLFDYRFGNLSYFLQFGISGTLGLLANLSVLKVLLLVGLPLRLSVGLAIVLSMGVTFLGNRFVTFNHGKEMPWLKQYFSFVSACAVGALVNWAVTVNLIQKFLMSPTAAALIGVGAGMGFNFVFSRYIIFRSSIVGPSKK